MNRKTTGALLMGVGALLVLLSAVLIINSSGSEDGPEAVATTTTAPTATTNSDQAPTTTSMPETTSTSSAPATTSTTINAADQVSTFIENDFAPALANGDVEAIQGWLHPDIKEAFGEDACNAWIDTQIMGLANYTATSDPEGPTRGSLSTPTGTIEFDNRYSVAVTFDFGGQSFDSTADFIVDGEAVYFTGNCTS